MTFLLLVAYAINFLMLPVVVSAQQCASGTATEIKGNWYCSAVNKIVYMNFPGYGSYKQVIYMNASNGVCESIRSEYNGSLGPLDEEVSIHVRGPIWLKELAVYTPASTMSKRDILNHQHKDAYHHHGSSHKQVQAQLHKHKLGKKALGDSVTATINGQVEHWINEYVGPAVSTHPTTIAKPSPIFSRTSTATSIAVDIKVPASSSNVSSVKASASTTAPNWNRQAYYNAGQGVSNGFTFLNHFGEVSNIPEFGASLSYASSDARSGANSPQILDNAVLGDNVELVILSNQTCGDEGKCGYTRPGGLAYHGFGWDQKIFLLSFSMPLTGNTDFNGDMPAIWLMNAQIPLTSQYGTNPACSCWTSGCGELDAFEVLDSGNTRCKSALHMAPAGGSLDYFVRPVNQSIKAAIAFTGSNETLAIQVIDDSVMFEETFTAEDVESILSQGGTGSVFKLTA